MQGSHGSTHAGTRFQGDRLPQAGATQRAEGADSLLLPLQDHEITCVIPSGASITGQQLSFPGGVLIQGMVIGDIICRTGSIIVAAGARVCGNMTAQNVYIAGTVVSRPPATPAATRRLNLIRAVGHIALSDQARVNADLCAMTYDVASNGFTGRIYDHEERISAFGEDPARTAQTPAQPAVRYRT